MNDPSVRLICIAPYHNTASGERYARADVLEVSSERAAFLFADSPGSFRYDDVTPEVVPAATPEVVVEAVTPAFVGGNVVVFADEPPAAKSTPARKRSRG